ncbi:MAG: PepSY domain-containing protein [Methylomonas sp.]|jgi:uncharacterized iron-regulated membrane protein|uniref:PepSY-associated TM helix domain-containing protein n=1 Tax=Methylomonas sp. TaxID=418 RepID=UPI0025E7EFDD|nr:PepSY-associated TM helix domain-containing protein [Methylomonas sp.]MCK9607667.1 PepSY domain-containing protein [Methylomonas sp.]
MNFSCNPGSLARLKRRRRFWLQCHLWLGLTLGLILAIAGITGSILVFWQELDAWLNPALRLTQYSPSQPQHYRPVAEIIEAARSAYPTGTQPGIAEFRRVGEQSAVMFFGRDMGKSPSETNIYNVFVDPYSAKVLGVRLFYDADNPLKHALMGFVFKLHYAFLMKDTARTVIGWVCAVLLVSVLSGLILWWPLTGQWRKALTFRLGANSTRFNFDLHKIVGLYTALVLLAVLFSGTYLNLPEQVLSVVRLFTPDSHAVFSSTEPNESAHSLQPDAVLEVVEARYPNSQLLTMIIPVNPKAVYKICHRDSHSLREHWIQERCVVVDQYSGAILNIEDAESASAGDIFLQWQWYIHSGQAFGITGRLLVFVTGFACPVLFVTGLIRWLQKRRAANQHQAKQYAAN